MPKATVHGFESFGLFLNRAQEGTVALMKMGVYDANHIIYEEVKNRIKELPTSDKSNHYHELSEDQKQGLMKKLYGSQIMDNGEEVYAYISVDGYNNVKTDKYPNGQPNIMILRSVENGGYVNNNGTVTVQKRHSVMRVALNHAKARAIEAAAKTIKEGIKELQKEK